MKAFARDENAYALILGAILLPVFLGFGLIVIDLARANNAQSDLSYGVDALALAGARELDRAPDAIERANQALANLENDIGFFSPATNSDTLTLTASGSDKIRVNITYLDAIPPSDDTPIDDAFLAAHATTDGKEAQFIHIRARTQDLRSFFPFGEQIFGSMQIRAEAVAAYRSTACNVAPLFICNPEESSGIDFVEAFNQGLLHGRLFKLHPRGNETVGPGNFGFLQVNTSSSADAVRDLFAGAPNATCYRGASVETKPGAATSIRNGINTRFDIYAGNYGNSALAFPPAPNVRKGYVAASTGANSACNTELSDDPSQAMGFPENFDMTAIPGGYVGAGDWDLEGYWALNHPSRPLPDYGAISSSRGANYPAATIPSRFDVYRYEIEETILGTDLLGDASVAGEIGYPACFVKQGGNVADILGNIERRIVFAAVVDCLAADASGQSTLAVSAYSAVFLTNPMEQNGSIDGTLDVEIIDVSGSSGEGVLDGYVREEAILVR